MKKNFKERLACMVMAAAVAGGSAVMPVFAEETVIWSDEITENTELVSGWYAERGKFADAKNASLADDNGDKVIKLENIGSSAEIVYYPTTNNIIKTNTGIYEFKFDIKIENSTNTYIDFKGTSISEVAIAHFMNGKIYLPIGTRETHCGGTYEQNKWYTVALTLDTDRMYSSTKITDEQGNVIACRNGVGITSSGEIAYGFRFRNWQSGSSAYINNCSLKKIDSIDSVLIDENFENFNKDMYFSRTGGTISEVAAFDGSNKVAEISKSNNGWLWYPTFITENDCAKSSPLSQKGDIKISFDAKFPEGVNALAEASVTGAKPQDGVCFLYVKNGSIGTQKRSESSVVLASYFDNAKWYTFDVTVHVDENNGAKYDIVMKDTKSGKAVAYKSGLDLVLAADGTTVVNSINSLLFREWSVDKSFMVDNIKIQVADHADLVPPTVVAIGDEDLPEGYFINENFDDMTSDTELKKAGWIETSSGKAALADSTDTDHGKVLKTTSDKGGYKKTLSQKLKGTYEISESVKLGNANMNIYIDMGDSGSGTEFNAVHFMNGNIYLCSDTQNRDAFIAGTVEKDKWYTIKTVVDTTAGYYNTQVIDESTGLQAAYRNGIPMKGQSIDFIRVRQWSNGVNAEFDNFYIKTADDAIDTLIFEDDMEGYDDGSGDEPKFNYFGWSNINSVPNVTEVNGDKALAIGDSGLLWSNSWHASALPMASTGKIQTEFEINIPSGRIGVVELGGGTSGDNTVPYGVLPLYFNNGNWGCGAIYSSELQKYPLGSYIAEEWYKVVIVADTRSNTYDISIYKADDNTLMSMQESVPMVYQNQTSPKCEQTCLLIRNWTGGETGVSRDTVPFYIDDIKITHIPAVADLDEKYVTMTDAIGNTINDFGKAVTPSINSIELDFGAMMDEATLAGAVKLTSEDGDVAFSGTSNGSIYKMTLDKMLKENTRYRLTVSDSAKDLKGNSISAFTMYFTTKKSELEVSIDGLYSGITKIEEVSGITAGSALNFKLYYSNPSDSDEDVTCIIAYYGADGKMLATSDKDGVLAANTAKIDSISFAALSDMSDVDSIKLFVWNSVDEMKPMCVSLTI